MLSFNFDEGAHQHPHMQPELPAPASSQEAPPTSHPSSPTTPRPIKQEPESQHEQQQLRSAMQDQQQPQLSSPVRPSQASTTSATTTPTQASRRPPIMSDPAEVPSSPPPPQSSYLPETYCSHVSADDQIPPSQPTQLHLKQILLQPSTQTQTQTQDDDEGAEERDRVPDSQEGGQHEEVGQEGTGAQAARGDGVKGLVMATQMMQQGSVGEEFSLPPPPPWSQTQTQSQTQETMDEE
ncbi:hypothetical protein SLS55_002934 [Diplodia seriata]|uniref:Uncharacterized protein n=1 Tax=Diplodia seriata TaxID=420778 RepID=A0ABR3CPV4_9PEZI